MYIEVNYTGYLIVQVQKIGISRGKNVFHGFHGWIVDFTGLPQKQPISRTRDTVKKEGPCQPKLRFYKLLKSAFAYEPYLDLPNASCRKATSRLRGSSHTLNIETGRYIDQSDQRLRLCEFCRKYLRHDITEDEAHLLTVCPLYHAERSMLPDATLTLLLRNEYHNLNFADVHLSKFISGSFQTRKAWKEKEKQKK